MSVLSNIEFSILNTNLVKETEDSKKIKYNYWEKNDNLKAEKIPFRRECKKLCVKIPIYGNKIF